MLLSISSQLSNYISSAAEIFEELKTSFTHTHNDRFTMHKQDKSCAMFTDPRPASHCLTDEKLGEGLGTRLVLCSMSSSYMYMQSTVN